MLSFVALLFCTVVLYNVSCTEVVSSQEDHAAGRARCAAWAAESKDDVCTEITFNPVIDGCEVVIDSACVVDRALARYRCLKQSGACNDAHAVVRNAYGEFVCVCNEDDDDAKSYTARLIAWIRSANLF